MPRPHITNYQNQFLLKMWNGPVSQGLFGWPFAVSIGYLTNVGYVRLYCDGTRRTKAELTEVGRRHVWRVFAGTSRTIESGPVTVRDTAADWPKAITANMDLRRLT